MCFHPVPAACYTLLDGKQKVVFNCWHHLPQNGKIDFNSPFLVFSDKSGVSFYARSVRFVFLPCGKCLDCRAKLKRMWSLRLQHELRGHEKACFITLTYDQDNLPEDLSLKPKHLQDFIKRLRFAYKDQKIRYFACGEYGSSGLRPHYHLIVFGLDDKDFGEVIREVDDQNQFSYVSCPRLQKIWNKGFVSLGKVSNASISYVAGYVQKKLDKVQLSNRVPEFVRMSTHPGIGRDFFEKYQKQILDQDRLNFSGCLVMPPRYYDKLNEQNNPVEFARNKQNRLARLASVDFDELKRKEDFFAFLATKQGHRKI